MKLMRNKAKQAEPSLRRDRKTATVFYWIMTPIVAFSIFLTFLSSYKAYPFPSSYLLLFCAAIQISGWAIGLVAARKMRRRTMELLAKNKKIREMQERLIISIAELVESKDSFTGMHVQRTARYVERICAKMIEMGAYPNELNERTAAVMVKAAPLHDMGKIRIPETILEKPGKLSDEEFKIIKMHPLWGEKIIEKTFSGIEDEDFTQCALQMALTHHEKWDGSGYPLRLIGEDIPLCGRIMAAADVLDALLTVRPYKRAFTIAETMNIFADSAGKQFDPIVAEAVLQIEDEITMIQLDTMNDYTIKEAQREDRGEPR